MTRGGTHEQRFRTVILPQERRLNRSMRSLETPMSRRSKLIHWLGQALDRGIMAGSDLMVATAALRAERKAWVRSIDVTARLPTRGASDGLVTARYQLGSDPEAPTLQLLLDGRTCPFPVVRFESDTLTPSVQITGRREPLLPLEPGAHSWDGASFELDIVWPSEHSDYVLPNMLPQLISSVPGANMPLITLHRGGSKTLSLAGIPLVAGGLAWGSPLIEGVLVRGGPVGREKLILTERLAAEFDEHEIERSEELVNLILTFLERELGVVAGARVVARAGTEYLGKRLRGGSCIVLDDGELRAGPSAGDPNDLVLAFQLASVWWGGGCRVTGRRQYEMVTGLRLFLALRWLRWIEPAKVPPTIERLRSFASWGFLKSRSYAVEQGSRGDLSSRMAVALYDHAERSPRVMDVMRQLTRETWGKHISVDTVKRRFHDAGVPIRV